MASEQGHNSGPFESLQASTLVDTGVDDLPQSVTQILTDAEKRRILVEWNRTESPYPEVCVHELFEAQAARTPKSVAVVYRDQCLTYAELNSRANQIAHPLIQRGVGPEVPVGICLRRSLEMIAALLGVLKAGGACMPLDPEYPPDRLAFMQKDANVPVVITQPGLLPKPEAAGTARLYLDTNWNVIDREGQHNPEGRANPENVAYLIYTSGSTGRPQGVLLTHRGLVNHNTAVAKLYGLVPADRVLQFSSISFDLAIEEIFPILITGGAVVLKSDDVSLEAAMFLRWIGARGISVLDWPTAYWHDLVRQLPDLGEPLPDSLRLVIVGGEKASAAAFATWLKVIGNRVRWVNTYGPTEASVISTAYEPNGSPRAPVGFSNVPIGRPIANTQIYLLDSRLQPVPIGTAGELHIGGDGLARGYLNRPDLTAQKFISNPFSNQPGARLYKTGDLARYLPDGNIEFLGRLDDQVKIRGYRIEVGEIEAVLAEIAEIDAAVVVTREDSDGDRRLVACVVPKAGRPLAVEELRGYLKARLPEHMLPSRFELLESLPLTPNGKVDRRALALGSSKQPRAASVTAPRTELEEKLARVFAEVLNLSHVGTDENFFDLGGDSLRALELIAKVDRDLGQTIPIEALLTAQSVKELATLLSQQQKARALSGILPLQPLGSRPPFFCLGAGPSFRFLARRLAPDQPFLGVSFEKSDLESLAVPFRLEDLTACLVKRIRGWQPHGPYFLGGRCHDAILAFEAARQLQANGEKVGLLVLLDPNHPVQTLGHSKGRALSERFSLSIQRIRFETANVRKMGAAYFRQGLNRLQKRLSLKARSVAHKLHMSKEATVDGEMRDGADVVRLAMLNYRPEPYAGQVAIVQSERPQQDLCPGDKTVGWSALITGRLDVHSIPDLPPHDDPFPEPYAELGAKTLRAILSEAQSAGAPTGQANS